MTTTTTPPTTTPLKIYTLTFNCARQPIHPTRFAANLFDALPLPLPKSKPKPPPPHPPHSPKSPTTATPRTKTAPPPDILIFSLQEIAPIAYAFLGGKYLSETYLRPVREGVKIAAAAAAANLAAKLGSDDNDDDDDKEGRGVEYVNIVTENVGLTAIMVFVLREGVAGVKRIETAGVGVGVWGMGNKGAVGVRIGVSGDGDGDSNMVEVVAVAAHLAPMEDALERRNEDWGNICRGLVFTPVTALFGNTTTQRLPGEESSDPETEPLLLSSTTPDTDAIPPRMTGIYTPTSHLILAGDLNYRTSIAGPISEEFRSFPQPCSDDSYPQHYEHLFQSDQLTAELRAQRTCHGLREVPVEFPPTYKYSDRARRDAEIDRGDMDEDGKYWDWAKHRWPSWCDRILYLPMPSWAAEGAQVEVTGYQALPLMPSSDHRPVACCLEIPAQAIPEPGRRDGNNASSEEAVVDRVRIEPPFPLDPNWKVRRTWARRQEIMVGLGAYLSLTWEGRGVLLALVCGALGAWAVIGGLKDSY